MSYDEVLQILIALCPAFSAVITLLIGFLSLVRTIKAIKSDNDNTKEQTLKELEKFNRNVNKINAKVSSIERTLMDEREGK